MAYPLFTAGSSQPIASRSHSSKTSDRKISLSISGPYSWLPDNRRIAFVRRSGELDALCTIGRDGSGEEEILKAREIYTFEWSPHGEWILYSAKPAGMDNHAIFGFRKSTGETRQLTFPPAGSRGDEHFAISPGGEQLAFRRTLNYGNSDLLLTSLRKPGPPRQITFHQTAGDTLAWISDGTAIIASTSRGSNESLWLYPLNSPEKPTRLTEVGIDVISVRSALKRNRLVWTNVLEDTNIWSVPVKGGKPERVISSSMRDVDVALSSLGVFAFRSDRSGFSEIWIAAKDGGSQKKVTELKSYTGSPRWSPDGRRMAFGSRRWSADLDVYVMDCDPSAMQCSSPVQVTHHAASDTLPNWSIDGSSIYFASQRSGKWQVWKTPAPGKPGDAVQMTTQGGFFAAESADGTWLYYSRTTRLGLWVYGGSG